MYLALWIDDEKERPHDRIVMVKPLLKNQTAAIALLQSERRAGADAMILSGDIAGLNQFAAYVNAADEEWSTHDNAKLLEALQVVAEKAGCSIVPFGDLDGHAAAMVLAALKQPRPGLYPRYITKEAKLVWDEVLKHYKKTIAKYKADKERMWAAAIIIFKRICGQRGITPFKKDFGDQDRERLINDVHRLINRGNFKALKEVAKAAGQLAKEKLAGKLTNEKFYESAEHKGRFYLTTVQTLNTPDSAAVLEFLAEKLWGMGVPGQYLTRAVDQYTDILVEPMGGKKLYFFIATHLTREMLVVLFPTLEKADQRTILRTLSKAGRKWVKTGTMKALAAVDLIDGGDEFIREVLAKLWIGDEELAAAGR